MTASTTAQAAAAASAASIAAAASAAPSTTESVATMRAAVQRTYAEPDAMRVEDVPVPTPGPGQVLLEVRAAGVDRGVWHLATGRPLAVRAFGFGLRRPRQPIQGSDVAGVVVGIGAGVTRFAAGDTVLGNAVGAYAEFALASEDQLVASPKALSFAEAAATAISGIAAMRAVEDVAKVSAGDRVLVFGASGGVGSYAVQLAHAAGATVVGVASAAKSELVLSLGAERVVDHATADVTEESTPYDVIIVAGGLTPLRKLRRILAPTGTLVIVGGEGGGIIAGGAGRSLAAGLLNRFTRQNLVGILSTTTLDALERLTAHIVAGDVRPALTRTYPLEDAAQAITDLASGRIAGKAAITVRGDR